MAGSMSISHCQPRINQPITLQRRRGSCVVLYKKWDVLGGLIHAEKCWSVDKGVCPKSVQIHVHGFAQYTEQACNTSGTQATNCRSILLLLQGFELVGHWGCDYYSHFVTVMIVMIASIHLWQVFVLVCNDLQVLDEHLSAFRIVT